MMSTMMLMLPLPMPWMALPAISMAPLVAPPQMPLPSVKKTTMENVMHLRPKMLASWPNRGWTAALWARRRAV